MNAAEKRNVIELRGRSSISAMEALLKEVAAAPADTDLLVSNTLKERSFASTAAYMQLIVTWVRRCPEGRLRVHVHEDGEEVEAQKVLERALKGDHILLASALAQDIRARRGIRDLSELAASPRDDRFSKMGQLDETLRKGGKTFVVGVDDSDHEAPQLLYQERPERLEREPELLGRERFQNLANQIQERLNQGIGGGGAFAGSAGLSGVLYELFSNTHEWGRSDAHDDPYPPGTSARGLRIERHNLKASLEKKMVEDQPALRDFFQHPELAPRDGRRRFVEMTIFDSGPGVAARRLVAQGLEEPTLVEEHTALRDCLRKHVTSSNLESKGVGLHRVLTDLTALDGFLWLRTGRLSLYRDFVAMPYDPKTSGDEPFLLDWNAGIGGVTETAPVSGSFYTALLPIGHDPKQTTLSGQS